MLHFIDGKIFVPSFKEVSQNLECSILFLVTAVYSEYYVRRHNICVLNLFHWLKCRTLFRVNTIIQSVKKIQGKKNYESVGRLIY